MLLCREKVPLRLPQEGCLRHGTYTGAMPSPLAIEIPAFFLGLLFGSFLNVCIGRLPFHETVVKGRSHCPHCLHTIRWYDNVPLLSWMNLRARCRDCRSYISVRYPIVELAVGVWFWLASRSLVGIIALDGASKTSRLSGGFTASEWAAGLTDLTGLVVLGFLLIGLMVMDWETETLPDAFTLTGIAIGLFLVCVQAVFLGPDEATIHLNPAHSLRMSSPGSFAARGNVFLTGPEHLIFGRVAAVVGAMLLPWLIRVIYKAVRGHEGMGLGDVKLMGCIAAFLGFWPAVLAFALGSLFIFPWAVSLLVRRKASQMTRLPFGAFLAAGGLVSALVGVPVIEWYRSLL